MNSFATNDITNCQRSLILKFPTRTWFFMRNLEKEKIVAPPKIVKTKQQMFSCFYKWSKLKKILIYLQQLLTKRFIEKPHEVSSSKINSNVTLLQISFERPTTFLIQIWNFGGSWDRMSRVWIVLAGKININLESNLVWRNVVFRVTEFGCCRKYLINVYFAAVKILFTFPCVANGGLIGLRC